MGQVLRTLYPEIEPRAWGYLQVSALHRIYYERVGKSWGSPILILHGGPGSGSYPLLRRYCDPLCYDMILFDQRGSGKSVPHAELRENTTAHLLSDIEALREHLGISSWFILGGSWGSTLGLLYARAHPGRVRGCVLHSIFLGRRKEIDWMYEKGGASRLFPEAWERLLSYLSEDERSCPLDGYYQRLLSQDNWTRWNAAKELLRWPPDTLLPRDKAELERELSEIGPTEQLARISTHYYLNGCFIESEQGILSSRSMSSIIHIPGVIVHGRYDIICPFESAWELYRAWPGAYLRVADDAGHSRVEASITHHVIEATDRFARPRLEW